MLISFVGHILLPLHLRLKLRLCCQRSCRGFRLVVHLKSVNVNQRVASHFSGSVEGGGVGSVLGGRGRRTCHSVNCFRFRLTLPIRRRMSKCSGYGCSSAGCRHCCRFDGFATIFPLCETCVFLLFLIQAIMLYGFQKRVLTYRCLYTLIQIRDSLIKAKFFDVLICSALLLNSKRSIPFTHF